ncbi:hypothetical protein JI75_00210 [Berryella intestinalis]|uniref:Uncharacterized protein n=1 Tax=Berryella intestinalis TaxID=1531429 RepID=A0A0A8B1J0_9ACTN|nr:amino acid adenylation domain-containing protein [Berryella intestinalis]AJC11361.1 hypothetical protein JI75_00210 [Berryella intestinalis]
MQTTAIDLFKSSLRARPERVLFSDERKAVTYAQADESTSRIARAVLARKLSKQPVVIFLDKTVECLEAFLGVMRSGNFYSPIEISMPARRIESIFSTLEPSLVISDGKLKDRLGAAGYNGDIIDLSEIDSEPLADPSELERAERSIISTDLLYVLFTSGSTGVPKGVAVSHGSVIDFVEWTTSTFGLSAETVLGNQAPFYFDNSVLDIYSALRCGGRAHIIPPELFAFPAPLFEHMRNSGVNTIYWVPSALVHVANLKGLEGGDLPDLETILFCGEVMPNKQLNQWRRAFPESFFANLYGPTEATVACGFFAVDRAFSDDEPLPMGAARRNTEFLLLDEHDKLVTEPERIGELCIKGACLARGYYGAPEKTAEVFTQNPCNPHIPDTIYRTGDLAYYNELGELVFSSRKDFQIKLGGRRIELGEIETAASAAPGVERCCCLFNAPESKIVLFASGSVDKASLRNDLRDRLPRYMIPASIAIIDSLPLNANGKIDRAKLKEML